MAYCTSYKAVLSELATLKDMVSSGGSTRNEIGDQGQVVVEAAVMGFRDSNDLSESVRADDIQAATQAYKDAMDTYSTSIDGVRASQDC